uniref:Uncharacterized protein n=1 Tax=viral metagenome TaxID=1070528 RepID=A0A6C0JGI4_9ZZZZ
MARRGSRRHHKKGHGKQKIIGQVGCSGIQMIGGGGASDHVIAVVGGMNDQHANPGTNIIHQNAVGPEVGGSVPSVPSQTGGNALSPAAISNPEPIAKMQNGPATSVLMQSGGKKKQLIAGLAVPTVLLYANKMGQSMGKRMSKKMRQGMSKSMKMGKRMSKSRRTRRR